MTTKIDERKNILISLKSSKFGTRNRGIDEQIQTLKVLSLMNILLIVFCFGIIIFSIISEPLKNEVFEWSKTALYVLLSCFSLLNLPTKLIEIRLLNHLKKINQFNDFIGIDALNIELKNIIHKLNNPLKSNPIPIFLAFLLLIMSAWQLITSNNPYWIHMKLLIMLFFILVVIKFLIVYKKLNQNIQQTENSAANYS